MQSRSASKNDVVAKNWPCWWGVVMGLWFASLVWAEAAEQQVRFIEAFPHLKFHRPLYITHPRDGSDRLFVVEQIGRVYGFARDLGAQLHPGVLPGVHSGARLPGAGVQQVKLAVDLGKKVRLEGNEEGLLGLAFHPNFKTNRQVYLHYSGAGGQRRNVLSCFKMDDDSEVIDVKSERVILEVPQPWSNHNGGMIEFGPDGYLYVALGDGGAANDPRDQGQDKSTLLGKILRIDVDRREAGLGYALPKDNPFVEQQDTRGEIWAYGLRNPWRFSFDRVTGQLWAGDVGQDLWEEIDIIQKGGNYGWNEWEGHHPFKQIGRPGPFVMPVVEHGHGEAKSITGGYVYRGKKIPWLVGAYVYGDFETGLVWCLRYDGRKVTQHRYLTRVPSPASFGEDREGELYVTSFDGRIYTLVGE